jgi:hypothetical protein
MTWKDSFKEQIGKQITKIFAATLPIYRKRNPGYILYPRQQSECQTDSETRYNEIR